MTPVKQTLFPDITVTPRVFGNCLQASVASLLDMFIDEVPHFVESDRFPLNFYEWLDSRGMGLVEFSNANRGYRQPLHWGHHLISGPSPREGLHCIVGLNGDPVFDPHPSEDMLKPGTEDRQWFTFIFPKR